MSKDTVNYNYSYSNIGKKNCENESAWPKTYTPLSCRQEAKNATNGLKKQNDLCNRNEIDENTVKKNKLYSESIGHEEYWVQVKYTRTRTPK